MNRRGFIASILASCAAPAIVRADSLMRIVPRSTVLLLPRRKIVVPVLVSIGAKWNDERCTENIEPVFGQAEFWTLPGESDADFSERIRTQMRANFYCVPKGYAA